LTFYLKTAILRCYDELPQKQSKLATGQGNKKSQHSSFKITLIKKEIIMKNKVMIFKGQNSTEALEYEINSAIAKANKGGWKVVSAKTECVPFGERSDPRSCHEAWHLYFVTTIIFEKEV